MDLPTPLDVSIRTEMLYRLRTVAAHYRMRGRTGTPPAADFIETEATGAADRVLALLTQHSLPIVNRDGVCENCSGTGIEPSGVTHYGASEMVGCHECDGLGFESFTWHEAIAAVEPRLKKILQRIAEQDVPMHLQADIDQIMIEGS